MEGDDGVPVEENGHSRSPSPAPRGNGGTGTPVEEDDDVNNASPEGSESG